MPMLRCNYCNELFLSAEATKRFEQICTYARDSKCEELSLDYNEALNKEST